MRSWLELSRESLLHNLQGVRALVGPARSWPSSKPTRTAQARSRWRGRSRSRHQLVWSSQVSEGSSFATNGISGTILCLTTSSREIDALLEHDLTPGIFTTETALLLTARARRRPPNTSVDQG